MPCLRPLPHGRKTRYKTLDIKHSCSPLSACRRKFLESELEREELTLRSVSHEVGHPYHEAVWMLRLIINQFKQELRWLAVERKLGRRAPARHPDYVQGKRG